MWIHIGDINITTISFYFARIDFDAWIGAEIIIAGNNTWDAGVTLAEPISSIRVIVQFTQG